MTLRRQVKAVDNIGGVVVGLNRIRYLRNLKKSAGGRQSNFIQERINFFKDYELVPVFTKGSQKYIDRERSKQAKTTLTYKQLAEVLEKGRAENPPYTRKMAARPFISAFKKEPIPMPASFNNPNASFNEIKSDIEAEANERFIKMMAENKFGLAPRKAWGGSVDSRPPLFRTQELVRSITWQLVKKQ